MASSTVTNAKYLDYAGLSTLVGNIKTLVDNKIIAAKQVLGGRLNGGLATSAVQISLQTPSGFTVAGSDIVDLSTIEIPAATATGAGVMSSEDKKKLDGIAAGGEVNQNAFSNIKITNNASSSKALTVKSNAKTDTLNLTAGTNIKITGNDNTNTITIDNTYVHPVYAVTPTSNSSSLGTGSSFIAITDITHHENGHIKEVLSTTFTLPKLLDTIDFYSNTATVPTAELVNVVQTINDTTSIAGQTTASIGYNVIEMPTKVYVDNAIKAKIAEADALIYQGTKTATTGNKIILETNAKVGYLYKVAATGNVCIQGTTTTGAHVEPGDMIIANTDNPSSLNHWDIIERNIDGAVSGPSSVKTDGNIAVFNGTTGKIIKDGGKKISDLATSGHKHNITANGSGDSEITVNKSNGELAVTYNISHATHMTSTFGGTATAATADAWGESVTVKVPRLDINTYGHVTAVNEVDYIISIPAKPTHKTLQLETYWGDGTDAKDSYNTGTDRTWKIYKGIKSISTGTNIGVSTTNGVATITCSYTYSLPLAGNGTRGGIQIGFTTNEANKNYAVLLSSEKAYVNVPWTDTKVQSTLISTPTQNHYLLSSEKSENETAYTVKRSNVYITTDHILACAPSTVQSDSASKVITHSDAITTAMINALFA